MDINAIARDIAFNLIYKSNGPGEPDVVDRDDLQAQIKQALRRVRESEVLHWTLRVIEMRDDDTEEEIARYDGVTILYEYGDHAPRNVACAYDADRLVAMLGTFDDNPVLMSCTSLTIHGIIVDDFDNLMEPSDHYGDWILTHGD